MFGVPRDILSSITITETLADSMPNDFAAQVISGMNRITAAALTGESTEDACQSLHNLLHFGRLNSQGSVIEPMLQHFARVFTHFSQLPNETVAMNEVGWEESAESAIEWGKEHPTFATVVEDCIPSTSTLQSRIKSRTRDPFSEATDTPSSASVDQPDTTNAASSSNTVHEENVVDGEPQPTCSQAECDFRTDSMAKLKRHEKIFHNNRRWTDWDLQGRFYIFPKAVCPVCKKGILPPNDQYRTNSKEDLYHLRYLKYHIEAHQHEMPNNYLKCGSCRRRFTFTHKLFEHWTMSKCKGDATAIVK